MGKYVKKPVVIDAWEWDETETTLIKLCSIGMNAISFGSHSESDKIENLRIGTLEGPHYASKGDWIIKGIAGEFYPCKPEIFKKTYDKVDE